MTTPNLDGLTHFPVFEQLSPDQVSQLHQMAEHKRIRRYSYIYMPGDRSGCVYFLAKGSIKIATHSSDGKEVIKSVMHPHAMFGELSLVGESYRQDFAQALGEDVELFILHIEDFQQLMKQNNGLCFKIISLLGNRLRSAESRLEGLIFKDARSRIIEFIKESAHKRGRRVGYEMLIRHSMTQQDIANITGTSRQTVTSVLNELKKSDLIYFNRKSILIRDMAKLC